MHRLAGFVAPFVAICCAAHAQNADVRLLEKANEVRGGLVRHYQSGPLAEKVTITAHNGDGERTSTILFRIAARTPGSPARVRLDLGNLVIYADDSHLVATHAANPTTCFEVALREPLTSATFAASLPPVLLPQLAWGLEGAGEDGLGWTLAGLPPATIDSLIPVPGMNPEKLEVRFTQPAPANAITLRRDGPGWALDSLTAALGNGTDHTTRVDLVAVATDPGKPDSWTIDCTARTRVPAITELKPLVGEVAVGDPCPAISLITGNIEGWSISEAIKRLAELNPQPAGPAWIALVMSSPDVSSSPLSRHALRAANALMREFSIQRMQGVHGCPRLEAREVVVLEMGEVNPARIAALSRPPTDDLDLVGDRLFATTGMATFRRMVPKADAAVIVLDAQQRIAGVVRLDGRMVDADTIREELRRIISTVPVANEKPAQDSGAGGGP